MPGATVEYGARRPSPAAKGVVFNVMRFAVHDGPGIRTTVFLKGCPLRCWWCHNPESQRPRPEIVYAQARCLRCGECVRACPNHALSLNSLVHTDLERCRACGACAGQCLAGARQLAGESFAVAELLPRLERDRVFYEESGGGVTLSGGEPLLQSDFAAELLAACRARRIHTVLDTCGYAHRAALEQVAPHVDLFLFDLKIMDPRRHREMTGVSNELVLANLRWLAGRSKAVIVRVPVIPGCTDDRENLDAIRSFCLRNKLGRIDLLPYHRIARDKYARLQRSYRLADAAPPEAERMRQIAGDFTREGLEVRIGG